MKYIQRAKELRPLIIKSSQSLTDADASMAPELYDTMKYDATLISEGTKMNFDGVVMKAAVDLWDLETNHPSVAPTLWEELQYKEGIRIIPETITTTTMFAKDELGWWKEELYKSLIDNNVWTPEAYPAGWEKI